MPKYGTVIGTTIQGGLRESFEDGKTINRWREEISAQDDAHSKVPDGAEIVSTSLAFEPSWYYDGEGGWKPTGIAYFSITYKLPS